MNFDPLAYIESAFSDEKREPLPEADLIDIDVPTIGEFLRPGQAQPTPQNGHHGTLTLEPLSIVAPSEAPKQKEEKRKFRKTSLSSPRPRRAKNVVAITPTPASEEIWYDLPRNIQFLREFFTDSVTANYYTGDFKESREELIQRLLDPVLTLEEVSRLLGVVPATIRRYTNRNWLSHHRTEGGQRRFRLSDVVRFVEAHGRHPEE